MELLTANQNGRYRTERMNGRTYFVLPVRMIVPGVLTGNRGALLYREKEIAESVHAWNNVPIVVDHPKKNGTFISARAPDVISRAGVGYVFNAHQKHGNLDGEAWIDIEKLESVDPDMATQVRNGEKMEVSTGLGTYNVEEHGTYNGKQYTHVAKNHAPDHLALLTSETGACSLKDGCGLAVNSMKQLVEDYEASGTDLTFSQWQTVNSMCKCHGKCNKCRKEARVSLSFQPTTNSSQVFTFQPTINADDSGGIWRTTEDGSRIYIKDGQAYAGGPKGKALSKGGQAGKKEKKPIKYSADKETLAEFEESRDDIKGRIKAINRELGENGPDMAMEKDLAMWQKKLKQTEDVISQIKEGIGEKSSKPVPAKESPKPPTSTKEKKPIKYSADKETLAEFEESKKDISGRIKSINRELGENGPDATLEKELNMWQKKMKQTNEAIGQIKADMGKNDPESKSYQPKSSSEKNKTHLQGVETGDSLKNPDSFKAQAEKMGFQVKTPVATPKGDVNEGQYLVAKDKEGNTKGEFHSSSKEPTSKVKVSDLKSGDMISTPYGMDYFIEHDKLSGHGKTKLGRTLRNDGEVTRIDDWAGHTDKVAQKAKVQNTVLSAISSGKVTEADFGKWSSGSESSEDGSTHLGMKVSIDKKYGGGSGHIVGFDKKGSFALVKKGSKVESFHFTNVKQSKPKKK